MMSYYRILIILKKTYGLLWKVDQIGLVVYCNLCAHVSAHTNPLPTKSVYQII